MYDKLHRGIYGAIICIIFGYEFINTSIDLVENSIRLSWYIHCRFYHCVSRLSAGHVCNNNANRCTILGNDDNETVYIDGLVQERRNSSAIAIELRLSYTNP